MSIISRDFLNTSPAVRGPGQPAPAQAGVSGSPDHAASPAPHRPGEGRVADQTPVDGGPAEKTPPSEVKAPHAGEHLGGGLAALRERARMAQTLLGDQTLPIANQSSRLIMKLLGG